MSTEQPKSPPEWDVQALRDIVATGYTDAVVITDRNGRVLQAEIRREVPAPLGPLMELDLACHAATGRRLGLGEMRIAASLHDNGAIVCGRTSEHSVVIIASQKANLGQLLSQVRRVFPGRTFA